MCVGLQEVEMGAGSVAVDAALNVLYKSMLVSPLGAGRVWGACMPGGQVDGMLRHSWGSWIKLFYTSQQFCCSANTHIHSSFPLPFLITTPVNTHHPHTHMHTCTHAYTHMHTHTDTHVSCTYA